MLKQVLRGRAKLQKKLHMKRSTQAGSMLEKVSAQKAKKLMTGHTTKDVSVQGLV